jgi:hypothetical protein
MRLLPEWFVNDQADTTDRNQDLFAAPSAQRADFPA